MKKILGVMLVLTLAVLTACSGGSEQTATKVGEEKANQDSQKQEESKKEKEKQQTVFDVGDKIKLDGAVITVTDYETSKGGEIDKPDKGNVYVIVHLKIRNAGEEKISYNPFDYKLKNSKGQIKDQAFTMVDQDTHLDSGELAPGGTVKGTVAFQAPKGDKELQLIYQPNFLMENKTIKVNLK